MVTEDQSKNVPVIWRKRRVKSICGRGSLDSSLCKASSHLGSARAGKDCLPLAKQMHSQWIWVNGNPNSDCGRSSNRSHECALTCQEDYQMQDLFSSW